MMRFFVPASRCDLFIGLARLGKGSHVELGAALTGVVVEHEIGSVYADEIVDAMGEMTERTYGQDRAGPLRQLEERARKLCRGALSVDPPQRVS